MVGRSKIGLRGAIRLALVLTTLHTNDAVSSALRLMDMGAPGYTGGQCPARHHRPAAGAAVCSFLP